MKQTVLLLCLSIILILPACTPPPAPTPISPAPTETAAPQPTAAPTAKPTATPEPTAEPTATPEPTAEPTATVTPPVGDLFSGLGIRLYFTGELAGGASFQTEPGSSEEPFFAYPEHRQVSFTPYALPVTFHAARVAVYPVEAYRQMNPSARDQLDRLQHILTERPADLTDKLPSLPLFNAARMFSAQVEYLDFVSGSGIRYVTMYTQSFTPVNNYELFYAFQGLTSDGQYFVAAILPVNAPFLPVDAKPNRPVPPGGFPYPDDSDMILFSSLYPGYLAGVRTLLEDLPGDQYTPALPMLDGMLSSLEITQ